MATKKKATKKTKATTATEQELHEAQTTGVPKASPAIERDIGAWRKLNASKAAIEPKIEAVRKKLAATIIGLEVTELSTRGGPLKLQTTARTDWEAFARAHLGEAVINAIDWEAFARAELDAALFDSHERTNAAAGTVWGPLNWEALVRAHLDAKAVEEKKTQYAELAKFTSRSEPYVSAPSWFRKAS